MQFYCMFYPNPNSNPIVLPIYICAYMTYLGAYLPTQPCHQP